MKPPLAEYDDQGRPLARGYMPNLVRTAKYTPMSFIPRDLFEQFRNVANLYFLFLVIVQCIPIFGVTEPAVSAMPLIAIFVITGIKDAIEDWKRSQSDQRVNSARTLTLSHWINVNAPEVSAGRMHVIHVFLGFFCMLAGVENLYTHTYRMTLARDKPIKYAQLEGHHDKPPPHSEAQFRPCSPADIPAGPADRVEPIPPPHKIRSSTLCDNAPTRCDLS